MVALTPYNLGGAKGDDRAGPPQDVTGKEDNDKYERDNRSKRHTIELSNYQTLTTAYMATSWVHIGAIMLGRIDPCRGRPLILQINKGRVDPL